MISPLDVIPEDHPMGIRPDPGFEYDDEEWEDEE